MAYSRLTRTCLYVLLLAAVTLGACSKQDPPIFHDRFFAFGTLIELTLYGVDAETAQQASQRLEGDFQDMHQRWHAWEPGALQRTNEQLATLEPFAADADILPLIIESNRLSVLSGGLFNPTIGKLIALWGFHRDEIQNGPPPAADAIRQLVAEAPSAGDVVISGDRLSTSNPAVRYDLGGFAKGYGIDRAVQRLRQLGIDNAIVNAGGDLRAIGQHGDRPWRIGIRHPRAAGIIASIEISGDSSIFTSGDYERYYEYAGKRYHHIIDPRTGYPADKTTSVTVIHSNAATADAAATALFVAGPDDWLATARRMGIDSVMLVDQGGGVHITPAMQARVRFEGEPPPEIILSAQP